MALAFLEEGLERGVAFTCQLTVATVPLLVALFAIEAYFSCYTLPGVPELKGVPVLGVLPIYLIYYIPQILGKLVTIGVDGISYARIVNKVIISIQDPMMAQQILTFPNEVSSR